MQRVELSDSTGFTLHCPFCGEQVMNDEAIDECEHTLLTASDAGFEYIDPRLGISEDPDLDEEDTIDEFTDRHSSTPTP